MLIRSQDKKVLCQLSNIEIVERYKRTKDGEKVTTGYAVYIFGERNTEIFMAEYSTAEKAIKVLDMIEDVYCTMKQNECTLSFSFEVLAVQNSEIFKEFLKECRKVFIYKMPQDEEVEA